MRFDYGICVRPELERNIKVLELVVLFLFN
jgi:hypothetical protein